MLRGFVCVDSSKSDVHVHVAVAVNVDVNVNVNVNRDHFPATDTPSSTRLGERVEE
jgi:hypothetical protein